MGARAIHVKYVCSAATVAHTVSVPVVFLLMRWPSIRRPIRLSVVVCIGEVRRWSSLARFFQGLRQRILAQWRTTLGEPVIPAGGPLLCAIEAPLQRSLLG